MAVKISLMFVFLDFADLWQSCLFFFCSDLQEDLQSIQEDPRRSELCQQELLCRTLAGNNVYVLTISSASSVREEHQVCVPVEGRGVGAYTGCS